MKAIVMAAGKGTRLAEAGIALPKVLREANKRPLLSYVLDSISFINRSDTVIVTGFMHETVEERFADCGAVFAVQGDAAYGTGYAVMCGIDGGGLKNYHGSIVIVNGDAPLIKQSTVRAMCEQHEKNGCDCTLLSCVTEQPLPFGRIIRRGGKITDIKEESDCNEEEKKVKELNVGLYVFSADALRDGLSKIGKSEVSGEYYLTAVPPVMLAEGKKVEAYITRDEDELWGVNTKEDLRAVENILNSRISKIC